MQTINVLDILRKKGAVLKLSASNVDPNVVGGLLVVVVVGIFILYAYLDHKIHPHHSTHYSSRPERPQTYSDDPPEREELDPEEIGYRIEKGRQIALTEARKRNQQERIRQQNRRDAEEYYNNTLITGVEAPRGYDPL